MVATMFIIGVAKIAKDLLVAAFFFPLAESLVLIFGLREGPCCF